MFSYEYCESFKNNYFEDEQLTATCVHSLLFKIILNKNVSLGFNPHWQEEFEFKLHVPDLAFIRFVVYDDVVGRDDIIGQCTIPFRAANKGMFRECFLHKLMLINILTIFSWKVDRKQQLGAYLIQIDHKSTFSQTVKIIFITVYVDINLEPNNNVFLIAESF